MATTPNYGLALPSDADPQDVSVLDSNFSIIDTQIKAARDATDLLGASWVDVSSTILLGADVGSWVLGTGGSYTARMKRNNKDRHLYVSVQLGSAGVTIPTGPWKVTLLGTDIPLSVNDCGPAFARDAAGPFAEYPAAVFHAGAGVLRLSSASGTRFGSAAPFTWAVNDSFSFHLDYEVA